MRNQWVKKRLVESKIKSQSSEYKFISRAHTTHNNKKEREESSGPLYESTKLKYHNASDQVCGCRWWVSVILSLIYLCSPQSTLHRFVLKSTSGVDRMLCVVAIDNRINVMCRRHRHGMVQSHRVQLQSNVFLFMKFFINLVSIAVTLYLPPLSHHTHTHTHQNCSMSYVPDKLMWYTISATHWTHQMKKSLNKRTTKWNVRVLSLMRFSIPFDSTSGCGCVMCYRCRLEALSLEAMIVIDIMSMSVCDV